MVVVVDRSQPRCWVPALPFSFFLFLCSGGGGGGGGKQQPVPGTCVFFFSLFFCGPRWAVVVVVVNKQPGCWVPAFLLFVSFLCGVFASSFFFLFWVVVVVVDKPNRHLVFCFSFYFFCHWVVVVVVNKQPGCWVPAFLLFVYPFRLRFWVVVVDKPNRVLAPEFSVFLFAFSASGWWWWWWWSTHSLGAGHLPFLLLFCFLVTTGGRCVSWCALCWWLCTKTPSECSGYFESSRSWFLITVARAFTSGRSHR